MKTRWSGLFFQENKCLLLMNCIWRLLLKPDGIYSARNPKAKSGSHQAEQESTGDAKRKDHQGNRVLRQGLKNFNVELKYYENQVVLFKNHHRRKTKTKVSGLKLRSWFAMIITSPATQEYGFFCAGWCLAKTWSLKNNWTLLLHFRW